MVAIVGAFSVGIFLVSSAEAGQSVSIDVPESPAAEAINQLGRETGLQIIYAWPDVEFVKTHALKGNLEPHRALQKLLAGTGLIYKEVGSGTLVVRRADRKEDSQDASDTPGPPKVFDDTDSQTVLVRSSAVRGEIPNLVGIDELVISREEIEMGGFTSTGELVSTLPQNFGGGPNENTVRGNQAQTNSGFGSGVNLRGLSDDGTIVLLNGRRLAPSGTAGAFTDVANIPLAAIDHMEVIPEGATAIYGLDGVGGVVNFVTRQDEGFETHAEVGGLAKGAVYEERFGQSYGTRWNSGNLFALVEYDERDALPADRRRLATSDLLPFGGQNFDSPYGNPGTLETFSATQGYIPWAIPPAQSGVGLQQNQFTPNTENLYNAYTDATLLPRQQLTSAIVSGEQELSSSTSLFLDAILSRREVQSAAQGESLPVTVPANNPFYFNPAGTGPVTVFYNFGRDLGPVVTTNAVDAGQITTGVDHEGGVFSHLELYASFAYERQHQLQTNLVNPAALQTAISDSNPATAMNVFGDGSFTNPTTLAAIRAQSSLSLSSRLESLDFTGDRTLFHAWGGDAVLTLDEQYRRQFLDTISLPVGSVSTTPTDLSRTTVATYAQARVPLIGSDNAHRGAESLILSGAIRYEHYSDVGDITAPQFALTYTPWKGFVLRGTWARLAHAPDLPDLSEANNVSTLYILQTPPTRTSPQYGYTTALIWNGNNSQLQPETAKSWTLGGNLMPLEGTNLSLGLTYFHTDFANRISDPQPLPADVLINPQYSWLLPPVTSAERTNICTHSQFLGLASDCQSVPIGAIVDLRIQNVASLDLQGIDLAAQYELDHGPDLWKFGLNATYVFQYLEQQTPSSAPQELVSTDHNPINLRLRASLTWARQNLWAATYVNFQNGYEDIDSLPNRSIGSWTTVDSTVGYNLRWGGHQSEQLTRLTLSARNVFNHQPPFVNNQYGIGYDQENASLLGRELSLRLTQRW